jgi:hypothetical protein
MPIWSNYAWIKSIHSLVVKYLPSKQGSWVRFPLDATSFDKIAQILHFVQIAHILSFVLFVKIAHILCLQRRIGPNCPRPTAHNIILEHRATTGRL